MKARADTIVTRVRESELFPRIRDLEQKMVEEEGKYLKLKEKKKKKRKEASTALRPKTLPPIINKVPKAEKEQSYFSKFVVNKDPSNSKYMPFDEVYYPNIFNEDARSAPPHSIDMLWMLGFQHLKNEGRPKWDNNYITIFHKFIWDRSVVK